MELKTVNELFLTIQQFWIDEVLPRMQEIEVSLDKEDKIVLLNQMYNCARDLDPNTGELMPWREWQIAGKDTTCVKETIMGVNKKYDVNSMMFPTYKKFTTAVRCWKTLLEEDNAYAIKQHCSLYCNKCLVTTEEACCAAIKELIPATFESGGIFEQINIKLTEGEWLVNS